MADESTTPDPELLQRSIDALNAGDIDAAMNLYASDVRDFGRPKGAEHEVKGRNASIWTIRDGQAIRRKAYPNPDGALKAVGLEA
jgi:ketosteroid isomerase-like protein